MSEPQMVPASSVSLQQLTAAFNRAFEGYSVPLNQTPESLQSMVRTNDVRLDDSVVVLGPGGTPIGIGLLAIRPGRAWVGGMGLAPEWRGQGRGRDVMGALIQRARAAGVGLLQLEVLEENTPARRLYERLGFADERALLIYNGRPTRAHTAAPEPGERVRPLPTGDALDAFDETHAGAAPSWQRELASLRHMAAGLQARGLFGPEGLRAYVLFRRSASGMALLDAGARVASAEDRARQVAALVRALTEHTPRTALRAINVPPGDPLGDVLEALGCAVASRQREMALPLTA